MLNLEAYIKWIDRMIFIGWIDGTQMSMGGGMNG